MKRLESEKVSGPFYAWRRPIFKQPLLIFPLVESVPVWQMHRHERRLVPCAESDCQRCLYGIVKEARTIFPAYEFESGLTGLVDLPATHAKTINCILDGYGHYRDLAIRVQRLRPDNGPITCTPHRTGKERTYSYWTMADVADTIERLLRFNTSFSDETLRRERKTGHDVAV